MAFVKAQRKRVYLRIGLTGTSGSGKTYGALKVAMGLAQGKKIAMIDTENGSGSLYSHLGDYDVLEIDQPYTVEKYVKAIQEAEEAGYDVLIIDSLTHLWASDGGLLQQKEAKDARGGNSFTNWAEITKQYERFKSALLHSKLHILASMRSKTEYVQEKDDRSGKTTIVKKGLAPVMRDGMEYEFTVLFDVDISHYAIASKDRTELFGGMNEPLSEKHGKMLAAWLDSGAEVKEQSLPTTLAAADPKTMEKLFSHDFWPENPKLHNTLAVSLTGTVGVTVGEGYNITESLAQAALTELNARYTQYCLFTERLAMGTNRGWGYEEVLAFLTEMIGKPVPDASLIKPARWEALQSELPVALEARAALEAAAA